MRNLDFGDPASYRDSGVNMAAWTAGTGPNTGWTPIGDRTNRFDAILDGNGNTISNLTISRAREYIGLFGYIGFDGVVRNLTLSNPRVEHRGSFQHYVGSVAGQSNGTIVTVGAVGGAVDSANNGGHHRVCYRRACGLQQE